MEENEALKEAAEKLEEINQDERMQRIAELRDKAIRDEKSAYSTGINRGRKEGKEQEKKEIARKLLKMNMPIEQIGKVTELPVEEIQKLQEKK